MKIDRARAQQAFADYAAHYNAADAKVKLKIDHTYRVAALCARIAQSLALPPEDVDLAWLSGILHDVGRFEQLRRYNTFIDAQSVSHAALSVAVLFDEGRIRDYLDDAGADALLRTAVEWHSAFRLPEALDDRTRLFCQILRDADKIDILRVNVETPMEEIYNVSTAALRRSPVTPVRRLWLSCAIPRACASWTSRAGCGGCWILKPITRTPPPRLPPSGTSCTAGCTRSRREPILKKCIVGVSSARPQANFYGTGAGSYGKRENHP